MNDGQAALPLAGKVALVTGSGSGLGRAIAAGLASAGADVAGLHSTHPGDTGDLVRTAGRRFAALQCDLAGRSPGELAAVIDSVVNELGRLDILVNNAGIIRRAAALDQAETDWSAMLDVNLTRAFFLSQAFGRYLVAQGNPGKIINLGSMLSFQGGVNVAGYAASKSALIAITKSLANEWAPFGINVNAIAPGYMATDATAALRADQDRSAEIISRIPTGRWGRPEDLQGTAVLLASSGSDYINGVTIPVDGGWLAR